MYSVIPTTSHGPICTPGKVVYVVNRMPEAIITQQKYATAGASIVKQNQQWKDTLGECLLYGDTIVTNMEDCVIVNMKEPRRAGGTRSIFSTEL